MVIEQQRLEDEEKDEEKDELKDQDDEKQAENDECVYCSQHKLHPMFCYLITASDKDNDSKQTNQNQLNFKLIKNGDKRKLSKSGVEAMYIGVSRLPFDRLKQHNMIHGYRFGSKSTKALAGKWKMKLIVGPWFKNGAVEFKKQWRKQNKNIEQTINFAITESQRLNLNLITDDAAIRRHIQNVKTN